jgi:NAD(P)-dependent dehydrogenase (short-subunit alcohol dehydrogenase family)
MTSTLLAEAALDRFGHLDCWVNNAGVMVAAPILELTAADLSRSYEVNLLGTFHGLQAAATVMMTRAGAGGS